MRLQHDFQNHSLFCKTIPQYNLGFGSHYNNSLIRISLKNWVLFRLFVPLQDNQFLLASRRFYYNRQKNQNAQKCWVIKGTCLSLMRVWLWDLHSSFIMMIKANFNSNNVLALSQTPSVFCTEARVPASVGGVAPSVAPCGATVCLLSITSAGH